MRTLLSLLGCFTLNTLSAQYFEPKVNFFFGTLRASERSENLQWRRIGFTTIGALATVERRVAESWLVEGGFGLTNYLERNAFGSRREFLLDQITPSLVLGGTYNLYRYPSEEAFVRLLVGCEVGNASVNVPAAAAYPDGIPFGKKLFYYLRPELGARGKSDEREWEFGIFYRWNDKSLAKFTNAINQDGFLLTPRAYSIGLFGRITLLRRIPAERRPVVYHPRSKS